MGEQSTLSLDVQEIYQGYVLDVSVARLCLLCDRHPLVVVGGCSSEW